MYPTQSNIYKAGDKWDNKNKKLLAEDRCLPNSGRVLTINFKEKLSCMSRLLTEQLAWLNRVTPTATCKIIISMPVRFFILTKESKLH